MKNLIKFFCVLFISIFCMLSNLYSQNISDGELMIVNRTGNSGYNILIHIYPYGSVFNGNNEYALKAANPTYTNGYNDKLYGFYYPLSYDQMGTMWYVIANFDKTQDIQECVAPLGYGKYRIDFMYDNLQMIDYCYIDYNDADYGTSNFNGYQKIRFDFYATDNIQFNFIGDGSTPLLVTNPLVSHNVKVWEQLGTPNPSHLPNKGNFVDYSENGNYYHDYPIDARRIFGNNYWHEEPDKINLNFKLHNYDAMLYSDYTMNINECIFNIDDGRIFTINNAPYINQLTVSGLGAKFQSGNNSKLFFPADYQLIIQNHAMIESNGTKFQVGENLPVWKGIFLDNCGGAFFDNNCEFQNAKWSIYSTYSGSNFIKIANSKITVPPLNLQNQCKGTYLEQAHNFTIYNNEFILPADYINYITCGFGLLNNANSETDNNDAPWQSISIIGNRFSDGVNHIIISCLADALTSVNIKNNHFQNGQINMLLVNVCGSISENEIISNCDCGTPQENPNIFLLYSSPNFLNNYNIEGNCNNFYLAAFCYPNFAPLQLPEHQFFWNAGLNSLKSHRMDNIWTPEMDDFSALFSVEWGKNVFKSFSSSKENMYGFLNTYETYFKATGNCWNDDDVPQCTLFNRNYELMEVQSDINCNWSEYIIDNIITDKGNGIFDTIYITQSNNIPPPQVADALYSIAIKNQELKNYSFSINNLKNIINTYPDSKNLEKSIFNLYECYVASDTNHNQSWRNVIFGDLKNYLEFKIQQYDSNETFVSLAFDFLLKCKIKLKNYQPAMDGYAFIAENSPSATERLMASINYIDVEGLLQGGSGGQNDNQDYKDELSSDLNGKPIKEILLASYNKTKEAKTKRENLELQNSNDVVQIKSIQDKKHRQEKVLENRALENIRISGGLTKEERRERIQKDLMLLSQRSDNMEPVVKKNNIEPIKYELSQNYPNPFNPITNIKYQIQKTGLVTLKIYDIIGREIKTLVNEIKNPGSYIVTFNGSELASGVYFYRIQAGDFIQVKKMLLIK